MRKLPRKFYNRPTIEVATELIGCHLICNTHGIRSGGMIVEAEAYIGEDDPACHAFRGRTKRNEIMYGPPGFLYVYFTYGNHFMLNVVTETRGYPSAVLLRAVEPRYSIEKMAQRRGIDDLKNISSGPGKLARSLNVTAAENGTDLCGSSIYIKGPSSGKNEIWASPRIGIGRMGSDKLWRFFINDNPNISSAPKSIREKIFGLTEARVSGFSLS